MKSPSLILGAAAAVFGLLACGSSTAPDAAINQADANQLANDVDALSSLVLGDGGVTPFAPLFSVSGGDAGLRLAVTPVNRTFTNTRNCPVSGTVTVSGTSTGTSDPVARNLSVSNTSTKTDAACAFNTKNGVLTITGNPNVKMTGTTNIVAGKPTGLQTQTHKGSYTWSRGGKTGTCDVDVASSFDPTTGTFTVTGTMCGHTVNTTRTGPKFP